VTPLDFQITVQDIGELGNRRAMNWGKPDKYRKILALPELMHTQG
jgi:hypothetical protein